MFKLKNFSLQKHQNYNLQTHTNNPIKKLPSVSFYTLGCRLNQAETEAIASQFKKAHYSVVKENQRADIHVINTCTVTEKSDKKSQKIIKKALKNKNSLVIVTGCYAQNAKDKLEKLTGITYVVDNDKKQHIFPLVEAHLNGEFYPLDKQDNTNFHFIATDSIFRTRAYLKIQDGCDNLCTFCIIPFVRGKARSRRFVDILQNAQELIVAGYKELVITGVNISRYSYQEVNSSKAYVFYDVVKALLELEGDFRIHISSLEPENISEQFIALLSHPKMSQHLHLCLQSASETILLKMRRLYSFKEYRGILQKIRVQNPLFNLSTDIIVGFPTESSQDFNDSLQAVKELGFDNVHIFRYSLRPKTRAARLEQLDEETKSLRSILLHKVALEAQKAFRTQFLGKKQRLLVESIKKASGLEGLKGFYYAKGYGQNYVPLVYRFNIFKEDVQPNTFLEVLPEELIFDKETYLLVAKNRILAS